MKNRADDSGSTFPMAIGEVGDRSRRERSEKRTFILLLLLTCLALSLIAILLWWIPYMGFTRIHPQLPLIMAILFAFVVWFLIGGGLTLVFTIIRGKNLFFNRRIRGVVIRFLFPLLVLMGRLVRISKDEVRRSFVAINNQLVLAEAKKVPPQKLLVLLPQCLQNHECGERITIDINNCKACGKCKIKDLRLLSKKYGLHIAVATGGTLARKIVSETRPEMIIGVACERDLTSGIQDTYPIPVFGMLNKRPHGPCFDTDLDLDMVEQGIMSFLDDETETKRPGAPGPQ